MKNKIPFQKIVLLLLFAASFFLVYSFFNLDIPKAARYVSIFIISSALTYLYMLNRVNKSMERLKWLENRLKLWNLISYRVKKAGEYAFTNLPIGIIVFSEERVIEWANGYAKEIFMSPLVERKIELINPQLLKKINKLSEFEITIYGRDYHCSVLSEHNVLYLSDQTELIKAQKKYEQSMLAVGILNLDNLEVALNVLDSQERAMQMSNIIGVLGEWSHKHNIYLRGFSEAQYLMLMTYQQLVELMDDNFKVLDDVQSYCQKEGLRISASFGIACRDLSINQLVDLAQTQLSLALNRGGNQGVILIDDQTHYFGAKTISSDNRLPVFIRIRSQIISDLIKESRNVYIMAHKDMDADAFGACLAACKMVEAFKRESKIIFDEKSIDDTIQNIYDVIQKEHINIIDCLISPHEALLEISNDSLLIIVDCQYQKLLISEKILNAAKKTVIIDHHRRNNNAINEYDFLYSQSSASSTVELIVEMYEYLSEEVVISDIEATWMLMGIIVDTNNLMYRTSFRTFNVLAILQKYGAQIPLAQRFLREKFEEYVEMVAILNNLEIFKGKYGIALCNQDVIYSRAFLAKIADNIISVSNMKASFCIGKITEDEIGISARSLDEMNVQVIMEQMGGGGHFNNAATQIKNITMEEAKDFLLEKLRKIEDGGKTAMKIILTKDVRGKGKTGDIIDIPIGHANFLMRTNQAIMATVDNIKQLEKKKQEEKIAQEAHLNEMRELKNLIEKKPVKISVRVGKEGKLFGSVSSKLIIDAYKEQNNIVLDKRKMIYDRVIDSLGTYVIPIQLHKEVTANITIYVVEKK